MGQEERGQDRGVRNGAAALLSPLSAPLSSISTGHWGPSGLRGPGQSSLCLLRDRLLWGAPGGWVRKIWAEGDWPKVKVQTPASRPGSHCGPVPSLQLRFHIRQSRCNQRNPHGVTVRIKVKCCGNVRWIPPWFCGHRASMKCSNVSWREAVSPQQPLPRVRQHGGLGKALGWTGTCLSVCWFWSASGAT